MIAESAVILHTVNETHKHVLPPSFIPVVAGTPLEKLVQLLLTTTIKRIFSVGLDP